MSELRKDHSNMGLPRASSKRQWQEGGESAGSCKVLCVSPPHALCAEDVMSQARALENPSHSEGKPLAKADSGLEVESSCHITFLPRESYCESNSGASDPSLTTLLSEEDEALVSSDSDATEDMEYIDDEEDKDSGFIDGNSIDNSSDEELDSKPTTTSFALSALNSVSEISTPPSSTTSVTTVAYFSYLSASSTTTTITTTTTAIASSISTSVAPSGRTSPTSQMKPNSDSLLESMKPEAVSPPVLSSSSQPLRVSSDYGLTTVTSAVSSNTTAVSSGYQGVMASYDFSFYAANYGLECHPARTAANWSCHFYDGSQPSTNKYMEISPTKAASEESIQCDENGKSYLELGSAIPYNQTFSSDCFHHQSTTYSSSQPFTCSSNYGQSYYNSRQTFTSNTYSTYSSGDVFAYETDRTSSSYQSSGYSGTASPPLPRSLLNRSPTRGASLSCDIVKSSPRLSCYQQQRLCVFNMSVYKLNRVRGIPEPNLQRHVLICNTIRHIEREFESEGVAMPSIFAQAHRPASFSLQISAGGPPPCLGPTHFAETMPSSPCPPLAPEDSSSPARTHFLCSSSPPPPPPPPSPPSSCQPSFAGSPPVSQYYHSSDAAPLYELRDLDSKAYSLSVLEEDNEGAASASEAHLCSSGGAERGEDSPDTINWCSVLSLTSQSVATPLHSPFPGGQSGVTQYYPPNEGGSIYELREVEAKMFPSGDGGTPGAREESAGVDSPRGKQEDTTDSINWCSVLSLSSQSHLDSVNNNDYAVWGAAEMDREERHSVKLPSLSADDVLKSFTEGGGRRPDSPDVEFESLVNVFVGS